MAGARQVCRRVLSSTEAERLCEEAGTVLRDRSLATGPSDLRGGSNLGGDVMPSLPSPKVIATPTKSSGRDGSIVAAGRRLSHGMKQQTMTEENLNDLLAELFVQADVEGKVRVSHSGVYCRCTAMYDAWGGGLPEAFLFAPFEGEYQKFAFTAYLSRLEEYGIFVRRRRAGPSPGDVVISIFVPAHAHRCDTCVV